MEFRLRPVMGLCAPVFMQLLNVRGQSHVDAAITRPHGWAEPDQRCGYVQAAPAAARQLRTPVTYVFLNSGSTQQPHRRYTDRSTESPPAVLVAVSVYESRSVGDVALLAAEPHGLRHERTPVG